MDESIEEKNVYEAKKCIKATIKFFESLLGHLNSNDEAFKNRALFASWCIKRYMDDGLASDMEKQMENRRGYHGN